MISLIVRSIDEIFDVRERSEKKIEDWVKDRILDALKEERTNGLREYDLLEKLREDYNSGIRETDMKRALKTLERNEKIDVDYVTSENEYRYMNGGDPNAQVYTTTYYKLRT